MAGFAGPRHGMDIGFDTFVTKGRRLEANLAPAMEWLDENSDEPFFLFVHGFNTHRPYVPPSPYKEYYIGDYRGSYSISDFRPGGLMPGPEDLEYVVSQYDGEIAYVDGLIGTFLDRLDRRGLLEDTLVIITSDHGDEFLEHGACDHVRTLFDELVRSPWIMFGPGVPAIAVSSHVGTIDMLPTVLDLFGIDADVPFQGVSRVACLTPNAAAIGPQEVFSFTGKGVEPYYHLSSVRTDRWKLVADLPPAKKNPACRKCRRGRARRGVRRAV